MKVYSKFILVSILILESVLIQNISCFCSEDLDKVYNYETFLACTNLSYANLRGWKLIKRKFSHSNLRGIAFSRADLTGSDLYDCKLHGVELYKKTEDGEIIEGAIVKDADFVHTKGLTNEQKAYLRENGALNVPIDIEYNPDYNPNSNNSGVETEAKKVRFHKRLFRRFIRLYRRIRRLDKSAEVQVAEEEFEQLPSES